MRKFKSTTHIGSSKFAIIGKSLGLVENLYYNERPNLFLIKILLGIKYSHDTMLGFSVFVEAHS